MIEIKNLVKRYNDFTAVDDVSIKVGEGTIHGIIGENGSGKTTIIKCLTGIYKPDSGEVLVDGEPVFENPSIKSRIGYVADSNQYFTSYRISDLKKFYKDVYGRFDDDKFEYYNKIFRVPEKKRISQMSKGQQMRTAFMLNMAINPDVLVLDEPTSGLDVIARKELLDAIVKEVEERELTVFISSHHLSELEKICDTVSVIRNGNIQFDDDVYEVKHKIRKFQMVLPEGMNEGIENISGILNISNIGKMFTIVADSSEPDIIRKLGANGAEYIEEIEVSLEEMFIYSQGKGVNND